MASSLRAESTGSSRLARYLVFAGLAVALSIAPVVFVPGLYDDFTLPKQSAVFVAAALILLGLGIDGFSFAGGRLIGITLGLWVAALIVGELAAIDRAGSLLGVYQYRKGFLTQLSYVVVFAGALHFSASGQPRVTLLLPLVGLGGAFAYTAIQATGNDPVAWWVDTSDRAIGTIGNANELAAFAVMSLATCAGVLATTWRWRFGAVAVIGAVVGFIVLEAESRSGLGALGVFVLVLVATWWVAGNPFRDLARPGAALAAGFACGLLMSAAAGGLAGSADRVHDGIDGQDPGGSTRFSLWQGAFEVIKGHPFTGAGPDGLYLGFPVERPADLGGAFESYDLVAQSSHNYVLDTAANFGLPGLASLFALVSVVAVSSVRHARQRPTRGTESSPLPFAWAALTAYGALTLLNPISLAAHILFWGTLADTVSRGEPVRGSTRRLPPAGGAALAAPFVAGALYLAVQLPRADMEANRAWEDFDAQRFEQAATLYESAGEIVPFERQHASMRARALLAAAVAQPGLHLIRADAAYADLASRFGLASGDALDVAAIKIMLGDGAGARGSIDQALALNPHGVAMESYTSDLRRAVEEGGTLRYSQQDHWTYIVPTVK